jgi:cell wall assembly regulator SMI1
VKAGRTALRQAERRLPPELRRSLEKHVKDGQVRFDKAVKDIRTRVTKAAGQADLDRARKALEDLSKQVQDLARTFAQRARAGTAVAARRTTRATASTRRTATRKATTRKATTRKATTTRRPAARSTRSTASTSTATAARKPAARRRTSSSRRAPAVRTVPPAVQEAPGPIPERVEMPEGGA